MNKPDFRRSLILIKDKVVGVSSVPGIHTVRSSMARSSGLTLAVEYMFITQENPNESEENTFISPFDIICYSNSSKFSNGTKDIEIIKFSGCYNQNSWSTSNIFKTNTKNTGGSVLIWTNCIIGITSSHTVTDEYERQLFFREKIL